MSLSHTALLLASLLFPPTPPAPLLTTQQIEAQPTLLATSSPAQLEAFLQDLNRRKDFDYACHDNQPGPDAPFLSAWVDKVTAELLARGYYFDTDNHLHRPGSIIPVR